MKRVRVVLSGLRMRLFAYVHACISSRYDFNVCFSYDYVVVKLCYGDVVCVCREFYWCLWCWSVICVYVE